MCKMSDKKIKSIYEKISEYHAKFLEKKGVKLPALKHKSGEYGKAALVLVRLAKNYPNTDTVSKEDITAFIRDHYPKTTDVQQARHLREQKGWYIKSGEHGAKSKDGEKIDSGSYKLISLRKSYPAFSPDKRKGFATKKFKELKNKYGNRCATCGSKEGQKHWFSKGVIVKLQKGHMNPSGPLVAGNVIPQCQICNQPDKNRWVYNITGRVIEIADTPEEKRIVESFLQNTSDEVRTELYEFLKEIIQQNKTLP